MRYRSGKALFFAEPLTAAFNLGKLLDGDSDAIKSFTEITQQLHRLI